MQATLNIDAMETSRIFVRGLPPKFSEDDVRKHFAKFPVTDVKYFPARRIGYIGYKTPEDASKAVKYFNKSFIRMSKIFAEPARPVSLHHEPWNRELTLTQIADKELPVSRRQQKHDRKAPRNDEYTPSTTENNLKRKREEVESDPKLKEFLDVMQPPSKQKAWANEESQMETQPAAAIETAEEIVIPEGESDDEYQVLSKKPKTAPRQPSVEAETVMEPGSLKQEVEDAQGQGDMSEDLPDAPAEEAGPVSDADWLRSRTNRVLDLVEDDEEISLPAVNKENGNISEVPAQTEAVEAEAMPADTTATQEDQPEDATSREEDKVRQTGRLFLRNLHYDVTEEDLRNQFAKYGPLEEVGHVLAFFNYRYMMNIQDRDN